MRCYSKPLTISKQHEDGQIHGSFPAGVLLDGDAVAGGGEHLAAPDGDQLTALVPAGHVVQHRRVVDEGIQLAAERHGEESELEEHSGIVRVLCCFLHISGEVPEELCNLAIIVE